MKKETDNGRSSREQALVQTLFQQLQKSGQWAKVIDQLLQDVAQSSDPFKPYESGEAMLDLIVSDALKGVDIRQQYPHFYQQLAENTELLEALEDALAILADETSVGPAPEPIWQPAYKHLTFLQKPEPQQPAVTYLSPTRWLINWQTTAAQLQQLFAPPATHAYRFASSYLADPAINLIQHDIVIEGRELNVLLQATSPRSVAPTPVGTTADAVNLDLWVFVMTTDPETAPMALTANLRWGTYAAVKPVQLNDQTPFPPVPRTAIMTRDGQTIQADLQLEIASE